VLSGNNYISKGDLTMYLDTYQYYGSNNSTLVELSCSIDLSYLNFINISDQIESIQISIIVESLTGKNIINKSSSIKTGLIRNGELKYVESLSFMTNDDSVKLNISFQDLIMDRRCQIKDFLPIKKYDQSPSLSDIMFIDKIDKPNNRPSFEKSGLELIPLSSRSINLNRSKNSFYVYYQINNIFFKEGGNSWYLPSYEIIGSDGIKIINSKSDSVLKTSSNSARIEEINIDELMIGEYILKIFVEDLTTGDILVTERNFMVSEEVIGRNQILPMHKADIEKYKKQMMYIATYDEKRLFKKLSQEGKQNFIINFWNKRDPDLSTEKNEFLIEHFKRLEYCESNFHGGIDSDMSRIFIIYGSPVEINRNFSSTNVNKPVETWIYAINGVKEFIFIDRMENGEYKLIHSNHNNEINNPNWINEFKY
jgi:GWxTD domain-containing protein